MIEFIPISRFMNGGDANKAARLPLLRQDSGCSSCIRHSKHPMLLLWRVALVLAACAAATVNFASAAGGSGLDFKRTFLPKPFERNPELEMTVFSEITPFGKTLQHASPATPVYFVAHDSGVMSMGATFAGEHPPPKEVLDHRLYEALAHQGFLPAPEGVQATLVLIFHWGSHYQFDFETAKMFPELTRQLVLERAMLIGGRAYQRQAWIQLNRGYLPGDYSDRNGWLFKQVNGDIYYAVVSAYDLQSVISHNPRLAWRTTMTVNSRGIGMSVALPPLILTAADFLGKDMKEPSMILRTVHRGTVEMGPLRVIGVVPDSEVETKK